MSEEKRNKVITEIMQVFSDNDCSYNEICGISYSLERIAERVMKVPKMDYTDAINEYYNSRKKQN